MSQCHAKSYNCRRTFPHHKPWEWKALISVNVEDGILVQDGKARTAKGLTCLENYSPQRCNQWTIHWCRCGFRTPWEHKKRTQPDKKTIAKNSSSTLSCESCPFPPPPSTYTTQTGAEASDDRTDIVKLHTCQTLQNQCETAPKQAPQSNISKGRPPKDEIQIKICLRWTAPPFNMLARKFRKLKIAPPSRRQFF